MCAFMVADEGWLFINLAATPKKKVWGRTGGQQPNHEAD